MQKILALWSVPRSRSSAFTVMMSRRGDYSVLMEPFEPSAYCSDERIVERFSSTGSQYNYRNVLNGLLKKAESGPLFIKDHAYYFQHIADESFLSYFQHTFLIRHPEQALPSYFHKWPDIQVKETGYRDLSELFDKVVQATGSIPPVIDADDLVEYPEATVKAYCEKVGIPFISSALRWQPLNKNIGIWHDHLITTSGFEKSKNRRYIEVNDNSELKHLYDICLPYYEKLHKYKLNIHGNA